MSDTNDQDDLPGKDKLKIDMDPQFLEHNKYFTGAGGRLSATKKLGQNTDLQGYADLVASKAMNENPSVKAQKVGLVLTHRFAKGGSTASSRADGIAQRGKTRGKLR